MTGRPSRDAASSDAHLADSDKATAIAENRHDISEFFAPVLLDLGRVQTHRQGSVAGTQGMQGQHRPDTRAVDGRQHHHVYPGSNGTVYGIDLSLHRVVRLIFKRELGAVDMCMRVYQDLCDISVFTSRSLVGEIGKKSAGLDIHVYLVEIPLCFSTISQCQFLAAVTEAMTYV